MSIELGPSKVAGSSNLMSVALPVFDKSWAVNKEGGMDWYGYGLAGIVVVLVLVGLVMVLVGEVEGILFLGVAAVILLLCVLFSRRQRRMLAERLRAEAQKIRTNWGC